MRIDSSGNVGIGVTPTEKLDVYGSIKIGSTANSNFLNRSDSHWIQYNCGATTNDTFVRVASVSAAGIGRTISLHTNTEERMRINSAGDIGIGTGTPDIFSRFYARTLGIKTSSGIAKLQIDGSSYSGIDLGQ